MLRLLIALSLCLMSSLASAQNFPALSGRVVDSANILSPETEATLTADLAALETRTQRQLVVATVADLGGNDIADYGYRLGRAWAIGDAERDDGVLLLIAPNERRMHIAVGYGLESVLTDALSARIIRNDITPLFRSGDMDGGVRAGVAAITRQIELPRAEAEAIARAAASSERDSSEGDSAGAVIFWLFIIFFIIIPIVSSMFGGKKSRGRRGSSGPIIIWGGSDFGGGGGGFGGGGFGGGGGFSGGGGSFGGGGASGGW